MGYTPRTIDTVMHLVSALDEIGSQPRFDDRWVPAVRAYEQARLPRPLSPSAQRKLLRIGETLGLIERREHNPPHLDQRAIYWRVTEHGRKLIQDGHDTVTVHGITHITGQEQLEPHA